MANSRMRHVGEDRPLQNLVHRAAGGDEDALRDLYEALEARVYGLALRLLRDPDEAEEATVEVFADVWRRAPSYEVGRGSVAAWIAVMTRTTCIDRLRAGAVRQGTGLEAAAEVVAPDPDPSQETLRDERALRVREALGALPLDQKNVVLAAFFGGLTHRELAATTGQPLGTVKTRIRAGLAELRRVLSPFEEEYA